jgi:hypothetical protein
LRVAYFTNSFSFLTRAAFTASLRPVFLPTTDRSSILPASTSIDYTMRLILKVSPCHVTFHNNIQRVYRTRSSGDKLPGQAFEVFAFILSSPTTSHGRSFLCGLFFAVYAHPRIRSWQLGIYTTPRRGETPCVMKFGQGTSLLKAPRLPRRTLIYR